MTRPRVVRATLCLGNRGETRLGLPRGRSVQKGPGPPGFATRAVIRRERVQRDVIGLGRVSGV